MLQKATDSLYPVIPGKEDESWERFLNEGLGKFVNGTFTGTYEESLLTQSLKKSLPGYASKGKNNVVIIDPLFILGLGRVCCIVSVI